MTSADDSFVAGGDWTNAFQRKTRKATGTARREKGRNKLFTGKRRSRGGLGKVGKSRKLTGVGDHRLVKKPLIVVEGSNGISSIGSGTIA